MKYIAVPNQLICNQQLAPSDRKVALALLSFQWESKRLTKPLRFIAARANLCINTVRTCLSRLEDAGFLRRQRNYCYNRERNAVVYSATTYTLSMAAQDNYTLLPYATVRSMLAADITPSAFLALLLLAQKQGRNHDHAYPSLRGIAREVGLAKASVCRAISVLAKRLWLICLRGKNAVGSYFCNSYYVIVNVARRSLHPAYHQTQHTTPDTTSQVFSPVKGGLIFDKPPINKITFGSILREKTGKPYYGLCTVNRTPKCPRVRDKSILLRAAASLCRAIRQTAQKILQKFSLSKKGQQGELPPSRPCSKPP